MNSINALILWFSNHPGVLIGLGASSILIFIISILGISWFVAQIPEDYFLSSKLLEIDFIEAQKHYSEELLLSDYLPMYFFKPKIKKIDDKELLSNNIYLNYLNSK